MANRQPVRFTSRPRHRPGATNLSGGEQCCVPLQISSPFPALPAGNRRTVAAPVSTYRHDCRETALNYTNLNVANLQLLELPDSSEPISTGTVVEVTQSFTGVVKQILTSCEGVSHIDLLNALK